MEEKIKNFCKKWKIKEFSLFGSAVTESFNDESDMDILVSFDESAHYGFFDLAEMKTELEKIYGRPVDILTKNGVEKSRNTIRKKSILSRLKRVYAEG
ncbi:MAG: nucleotidyltransferase domain-containing protein [Chlorobi bacterium]|nr:nucleotidyltransferase domain-containing protein [Chlorobiota bacterium]MCI0716234.1 nucleotidyltransferase domain-containing protein [Chlorobiota bacterium]